VISGNLGSAGSFNFSIGAVDQSGCGGVQSYSIAVTCPTITIDPPTLPDGNLNVPYSQTLTGVGGTAPYTYVKTNGSFPVGITLDSNTGVLSGTPVSSGLFNFTIRAVDSVGCITSHAYSLQINNVVCGTITLTPSTLPDGNVGAAYSQTVSGNGGTA